MKLNGAVAVDLFLLILFSTLFLIGLSYDYEARLLPLIVTIPGIIFATAQFISSLIKNMPRQERLDGLSIEKTQKLASAHRAAGRAKDQISLASHFMAIGWVTAFFISVLLFGFHFTTVAFVLLFLRIYTHKKWLTCFTLTAICWTSVYIIFNRALGVILFNGFLLEYLKNILRF